LPFNSFTHFGKSRHTISCCVMIDCGNVSARQMMFENGCSIAVCTTRSPAHSDLPARLPPNTARYWHTTSSRSASLHVFTSRPHNVTTGSSP
jgi:hypothetical protein